VNQIVQGKLSGRVAIVTGSSKGIGRASALLLAAAGAKVVAVARSHDKLAQLQDEIEKLGSSCIVVEGDVAQEHVAEEATRVAQDAFGQLDILVNNAGIGSYGGLLEYDVNDYDMLMNTNMRSTFCSRDMQFRS